MLLTASSWFVHTLPEFLTGPESLCCPDPVRDTTVNLTSPTEQIAVTRRRTLRAQLWNVQSQPADSADLCTAYRLA